MDENTVTELEGENRYFEEWNKDLNLIEVSNLSPVKIVFWLDLSLKKCSASPF